jgi:predicted aminopeptidase
MARLVKKLEILFILLIAASTVGGCYVIKQGYHQGSLLLSAEPVEEYQKSSSPDPKIISKLEQLDDVLRFANDHGLSPEGSYEEIVFPENGKVSFLVVSAPYNSIKPNTYWFPFVGTVPYKGFFSKKDRDDYAAGLLLEGRDVYKSDVGAFSLLGYFDDPIFPSMLKRSEESMAHLFFHELTHKTIWIQNNVRFNERLAEFIAGKMTVKYLEVRKKGKILKKYSSRNHDRTLFNSWFVGLKKDLKELYSRKGIDRKEIVERKKILFAKHVDSKPDFKFYDYVSYRNWNNATVAITNTYGTDYSEFEKAYDCVTGKDRLNDFIKIIQKIQNDYDSPFNMLKSICDRKLASAFSLKEEGSVQ